MGRLLVDDGAPEAARQDERQPPSSASSSHGAPSRQVLGRHALIAEDPLDLPRDAELGLDLRIGACRGQLEHLVGAQAVGLSERERDA